jgi:hypothetical protein
VEGGLITTSCTSTSSNRSLRSTCTKPSRANACGLQQDVGAKKNPRAHVPRRLKKHGNPPFRKPLPVNSYGATTSRWIDTMPSSTLRGRLTSSYNAAHWLLTAMRARGPTYSIPKVIVGKPPAAPSSDAPIFLAAALARTKSL